MLERARELNAESALEGMTVTQLRARALAISKQITQLVSISQSHQINPHADTFAAGQDIL